MAGKQSRINGGKGGRPSKYPGDWTEKPCRKCGKTKARSEFYQVTKGGYGKYYWRSICKVCHNATTKKQCQRREYVSSYDVLWCAMKLLCEHKVSDAEKLLNSRPPGRNRV